MYLLDKLKMIAEPWRRNDAKLDNTKYGSTIIKLIKVSFNYLRKAHTKQVQIRM